MNEYRLLTLLSLSDSNNLSHINAAAFTLQDPTSAPQMLLCTKVSKIPHFDVYFHQNILIGSSVPTGLRFTSSFHIPRPTEAILQSLGRSREQRMKSSLT